jgi:tetratricopeptide (TPR) repeat protein
VREANYNVARDLLDSRRPKEALPLLEELASKNPDETRFQLNLAQCYLTLGRRDRAKEILETVLSQGTKAAESTELPAEQAAAPDQPPPAPRKLTEEEIAARKARMQPWADWLMGVIRFEEGDMDAALACLLRAEQADPRLPNLHLRIGETYLRQRRTEDAGRAFQKAIEIDGDRAEAHLGLAMVRLRQRREEEAAEEALLAVGLQHFLPLGHFYLGVALARMGYRERAALAFETSLTMMPGLIAAHRWLATLYAGPGGDLEKSVKHREISARLRQQRQMQATA